MTVDDADEQHARIAALRAADFVELVDSTIEVGSHDGTVVALEVVDVVMGVPRDDTRAPFTVGLRGPIDVTFIQGTYAVQHPRIGRLDLFLVPEAPDRDGAPRLVLAVS